MRKIIHCCLFVILCQNCTEEVPEPSSDLTGESAGGGISVGVWLGDPSTAFFYYPDWTENVQVEVQTASENCDLFSDFDHLCRDFKNFPSLNLTGKATSLDDSLDLSKFAFYIGIRDASNKKAVFNATPNEMDDRWMEYYTFYYNDFAPRVGHTVALMKDPTNEKSALWMVGGLVSDNSVFKTKGEVWKSKDGLHWVLLQQNSILSSFRHTLNSMPDPNNNFQMTLWKIGGISVDPFKLKTLNTVSKSTDGIHWETCTAPFPPRAGHSTVVMPDINNDNKMTLWVIGGYTAEDELVMDVWKSVDGCTWTQVNPSLNNLYATHEGAYGIQACVFEDPNNGMLPTMWLTGGQDYLNNFHNTIWKSVDGINWQRVDVKSSIFSGRTAFQMFTMNDSENNNAKTMYVLGGKDQRGWDLTDLWKTTDGIYWYGVDLYLETGTTMSGHQAIVVSEPNNELDGSLYIIGTTFDAGLMTNTLMKSNDLRKFKIGLTLPGWQNGNLTEFK